MTSPWHRTDSTPPPPPPPGEKREATLVGCWEESGWLKAAQRQEVPAALPVLHQRGRLNGQKEETEPQRGGKRSRKRTFIRSIRFTFIVSTSWPLNPALTNRSVDHLVLSRTDTIVNRHWIHLFHYLSLTRFILKNKEHILLITATWNSIHDACQALATVMWSL